jgi:hypothetical protein
MGDPLSTASEYVRNARFGKQGMISKAARRPDMGFIHAGQIGTWMMSILAPTGRGQAIALAEVLETGPADHIDHAGGSLPALRMARFFAQQ